MPAWVTVVPKLPVPDVGVMACVDCAGTEEALNATRHMYAMAMQKFTVEFEIMLCKNLMRTTPVMG